MKKPLLLIISVILSLGLLSAQTTSERIAANHFLSGSNYRTYPVEDIVPQTDAPKGYKPFYIDHYGRHGSRWLLDPKQYSTPVEQLAKAEKYGKLTEKGKAVLADLRKVESASQKRLGELTPVGADQHRGIAQRMYANFPEIFAVRNASIDARSSVVVRCILSMENEMQEFKALNPKIKITHDASEADMWYMNRSDRNFSMARGRGMRDIATFRNGLVSPDRFVGQLVSDSDFARDSIGGQDLMDKIFELAGNMQSHYSDISFFDLFTDEERYNLWQASNVYWYVSYASSPATGGIMPYAQSELLRDMIASADEALAGGGYNATLRFGHEVCVLPLVCLLELDDWNRSVSDLKELADLWRNYDVIPMGCNVQLVFYRKKGSDDILVKAMLNERETTLPVESDVKPYYHWKDVRAYYVDKLDTFANTHKW